MERFCESLALAGCSPAAGRSVVYADNRRQALVDLDPVAEALKGWSKLMRKFAVKPCPEEVIFIALHWLAENDGLEAAAAGTLQSDLYARPSGIFDLRREGAVAPSARAGAAHRKWAIASGSSGQGKRTKTGNVDERVVCGTRSREWLVEVLSMLYRATAQGAPRFPKLTLADNGKGFQR
ncbi:unnamed protein product [Prorocentrum cordatum]|uniref:Integrase catalytic domain-containing protein n=1 Tax=Prorocentrum cordatum TaxID=2364126 RepID=A0ABN9SKJ1_9DINO|nr:unnamed protein product [Polarella glacialis]